MSTPVYIYECQDCVLTFTVEQAFEDHSCICCPACQSDNIQDAGEGVILIAVRKN